MSNFLQIVWSKPNWTQSTISTCLSFLLFRRQAVLCVLATSCDEPGYAKLIEALCKEHRIDLMKVDDSKKLGEWAGLCKIDKEGQADRKSTRLNSSHLVISYAVFCLKK